MHGGGGVQWRVKLEEEPASVAACTAPKVACGAVIEL